MRKPPSEQWHRACDVMATARNTSGGHVLRWGDAPPRNTFQAGLPADMGGPKKVRDEAKREAVKRTDALADNSSASPAIERIRIIRDQILAMTHSKSFSFLQSEMGCSERELDTYIEATRSLVPM